LEKITHVEQTPVYQLFFAMAIELERVTRGIPTDFRWLRNQFLRSSESVCANMAEGFYSQYSTEYLQSLYRCRKEAR
jgi:four helix bundle protein